MPYNDFGSDPSESKKVKFGMFGFIVNNVKFESGASYQLAGVVNRDGDLSEFKGKRLCKASETPSAAHVVIAVRGKTKEGEDYIMFKQLSTSDKSEWGLLQKSLKAVFGAEYVNVVKPATAFKAITWVPASVEYKTVGKFIGRDGDEVEKTTWIFTQWFESEAAMRAAETAHFASYANGATSAATAPAISQDVINTAKTLWKSVKGDEVKFRKLVAGDSVLSTQDTDALIAAAQA